MNLVVISGNICKSHELRYTASGKPVLNNTLAVNKKIKKEDGTYDTDFIEVVFWNATATFLSKYTKKGDKISVTGSLNTRQYQNSEGKTIYVSEVIADNVEILYKRDKKENETAETTEPVAATGPVATFGFDASKSNVLDDNWKQMQIDESELPF